MKVRFAPFVKAVSVVAEGCPVVKVDQPDIAKLIWKEQIETLPTYDPEKEHLYVLALNTKFNLKGIAHVSTGSLNESIAHPREIFRPLIAMAAHSFLLMHNHPSGDTSPSEADRRLTSKIVDASKILMIPILDHVIVGTDCAERFSFRENGYIC